jgi:hypothetical protein
VHNSGAAFVRLASVCAVAAFSTACHDPDAYTLGPTQLDQAVRVTVSATAVQADGISRATITVQLDPATDADKRSVTLTTTAGTLIAGGREGAIVAIQADTMGQAVAELRSSTTPGTARVDVTVASITRSQTVEFTAVTPSDLFDVTVARPSIPADGFSTSRITVTLKRLGTPQQHTVRIEASAGTLVASGVNPARQLAVTADATGVALVDLQSEKSLVTARVRIAALDAVRDVEVVFTQVNPADIITLAGPRSIVPADGVTSASVTAKVASGLPAGRRSVTFRTSLGGFSPDRTGEVTAEADGSDRASADLASLAAGVAHVTATVDGSTAEAYVEFTEALPDRIILSLGSNTLRSGGSMTITATLLRSVGTVSPRLPVEFSAKTAQGAAIGAFTGSIVAENGVASASFNLGTTTYAGAVVLRASVKGGGAGTAQVQIVP